jgi:hypothetical protein
MALSRDQILNAIDTKIETVPTPEWGEGAFVCVRVLTGEERDRLEAFTADPDRGRGQNGDARARWAAAFLCDEQGARHFQDSDVKALAKKSAVVLDRVIEAGLKLNIMTATELEALEKNFVSGTSGASGSA